ncbi:hypothetical protein [Maribellus sp. YY47]|uniref:hypothetical protein n=1 Tax=Maribellus sp. YY47 TaxID=2929486 RepID=UPI00200062B6|nr:hypothetical protein [Maribellus sp. YY47]MCK3683898.1 hypothetical protein [Maribellus sp. YY47]
MRIKKANGMAVGFPIFFIQSEVFVKKKEGGQKKIKSPSRKDAQETQRSQIAIFHVLCARSFENTLA